MGTGGAGEGGDGEENARVLGSFLNSGTNFILNKSRKHFKPQFHCLECGERD